MKRILTGFVLAIILVFALRYCENRKEEREAVLESTQLIQEQLKNVGKLIVTEGHYANVYSYKDQKDLFGEYLYSEKKALVVVNTEVTVSYDLEQLIYEIDEEARTLRISNIPEAEIRIYPTLKFYDINDTYFNPFTAEDHNTIQKKIKAKLQKKIETSTLKTNARNRLLSELSKLYIVTRSLGWTVIMEGEEFSEEELPAPVKTVPEKEIKD